MSFESAPVSANRRLSVRRARLLAWTLFALSEALLGSALVLHFVLSNKGFDSASEVSFYFIMYAPIGALVVLKRPENAIGWLYCVVGLASSLGFAVRGFVAYSLLTEHGGLPGTGLAALLAALLPNVSWPGVFLSLMLFPDGHFLSSRWRAVGRVLIFLTVAFTLLDLFSAPTWDKRYPNPFRLVQSAGLDALLIGLQVILVILLLLCLISVALRFVRVRGEQRAQIKLFVYAASLLLPAVAMTAVTSVLPALNGSFVSQASGSLAYIWLTAMPLSIGLAILRYRLYDIDIIIRRTLVYSSLTLLIATLYWGGVVGLQALLRPITGQGNDLAIVATTLLIAALFLPLRQRVQAFIDRRFYRRRYDAARTLAAFSRTARDEVDLEKLASRLVEVVEGTMQPSQVSLWLRTAPSTTIGRESAREDRA